MTEAEEHNEAIFQRFKTESEKGDQKILAIISINSEGKTRVTQSALYMPKQLAEKLFRIANQIIAFTNKHHKPN